MNSARARSGEEMPGRLDIRKQVKGHLMSLGRSHCQSSFEEARTTDTQAQDWSCSASVIRGGAWSCLFGQLPTPWVLVEARTALVGEHHFPEGTCRGSVTLLRAWGMQRKKYVSPVTTRLPEGGSKSCRRGGACGSQQECWEVGMQRAAVVPSTCQGPQPWGLTV